MAIARASVSRASPRLPPSASSASAMARSRDGDADVVEGRRHRRVWLVHRHLHRRDLGEGVEHGVGDRAGGGLHQPVALRTEHAARHLDHLVVADRVHELVRVRGGREVDVEHEIELEGLPHFRLVLHHAVIGVQRQPSDEDRIAHRASRIAAVTRNACMVSATSCVRTMAAPFSTAQRWLAIEPPTRWSGGAGDTVSMKRLREAPIRSGRPNDLNSARRAMAVMLCSGVLPKPMPGSSTMLWRAMPARSAISSERSKKATMSAMMSIAGSARSRLCMMMTGTACSATTPALSGSRCRPQTSLTMLAPAASALTATLAFMVSIDTGTPSAVTAGSTGSSRRSSSSCVTATAPP